MRSGHSRHMQLFEHGMREPGTDMTRIAPCVSFPHGQHQRPETRTRPPRRGEADNDNLLPPGGLIFSQSLLRAPER